MALRVALNCSSMFSLFRATSAPVSNCHAIVGKQARAKSVDFVVQHGIRLHNLDE
jgi:hypothetical protein